jgi:septal ring-binding cell division protein DamX
MASSRRSSAGERVLEGRHVIGLFFLMLLFSGVFFTLGYVMGRNQLDAQVRAATTHGSDSAMPIKADPVPRQSKSPVSTPGTSDPATDVNATPPSSEWEFYRAGDKKSSNDHLKPAPAASASAQPKAMVTSAKGTVPPAGRSVVPAQGIPRGSYLLQVAALRVESEAIAVANDLRKKKFPAFVQTPQGDKYYRVQVGPYTDQKAMQAAKKGLETAGFKAITKH